MATPNLPFYPEGGAPRADDDPQRSLVKIVGLLDAIAASGGGGGGGSAVWGAITGTLSSQTDLQAALDAKAPVNAYPYAIERVQSASGPGNFAYIGGDKTGDVRGDEAIDIQAFRSNPNRVAFGFRSVAVGTNCFVGGNAVGIGRDVNSQENSVAIGIGAAGINNDVAIGRDAGATGGNATAIGRGTGAQALMSTAVGFGATARIEETTNLSGAIIIRKDNGEAASTVFRNFSGASIVLSSKEIDLTDDGNFFDIPIPSGSSFFCDSVDFVATDVSGVTVEPTVSINSAEGTIAFPFVLAGTAVGERSIAISNYQNALTNVGLEITTPAVATTYVGRFYIRGYLVENE